LNSGKRSRWIQSFGSFGTFGTFTRSDRSVGSKPSARSARNDSNDLNGSNDSNDPNDPTVEPLDRPSRNRSDGRLSTRRHVGIDAGRFGTPTFGPMTLTTGELQVR
jgi:hypothetical protein